MTLFGPRGARVLIAPSVSIVMEGVALKIVNVCKNLGVYLDTDLRFKQHTSVCLRKAYTALKLLYSNRQLLNTKARVMLCDSIVLSQLNFCDVLYHPCLDGVDRGRIQKLQNACLRFIYGLRKHDHISHTIRWCGWLNMSARRFLHSACLIYKIIKFSTPPYLGNSDIERMYITSTSGEGT